ncbi:inosine-uridine preferring nucleoside hydrolase [Peziza echinospora]|nr:inosine-uridine preferring nucleoside hydrolase [Peziza echinospora]
MATPQKPQKIIIDTDPGSDDILALLLALSAPSTHVQTLLVSLTFGNIDLPAVLRNAVTMFHVIAQEREWRASQGLPQGFSSLYDHPPPILAVGAEAPLEGEQLNADYFHGVDGLGGVHEAVPHLGVGERWREVYDGKRTRENEDLGGEVEPRGGRFRRGEMPAHQEILRILREEEEGSVVVIALGPLTNLAKAAEEDLTTFLRAKEVIAMGGAIDVPGNVSPKAEFNHYACAYSAARIYALTSPHPPSMLPSSAVSGYAIPWPPSSQTPFKPLNFSIVPIDITSKHLLTESTYWGKTTPLAQQGSPLAEWCNHFVGRSFDKMRELNVPGTPVDLEMHDPLTIYYLLSHRLGVWEGRDIRVEARGQWTRGMNVVETRDRKVAKLGEELVVGDIDVWLHEGYGNRVRQVVRSPGRKTFSGWLCDMIFA